MAMGRHLRHATCPYCGRATWTQLDRLGQPEQNGSARAPCRDCASCGRCEPGYLAPEEYDRQQERRLAVRKSNGYYDGMRKEG